MDEMELLRAYAESKSEGAFGEVARRYVNLVYSAALRQTGNAALAEDVTQAVFLVLARKAHRLRKDVVLSSWLLTATRYAARDAMKVESRRKRHEQRAAAMMPTTSELNENRGDGAGWEAVAPLLDDAVASLKEGVRSAIVLRYFERKSYTEIAGHMRITEVAARQRVSRALEDLRKYFSGRGIVLSAVSLKAMVVGHATHGAPASVGGAAASMGAKALTGAGLTARHAAMAHAAAIGMIPLGTKLAAVAVVVVMLASGAILALHVANRGGHTASAAVKVEDSRSIKGVVLGGDGKPVAGAEVYLAQSNSPVAAYGPQNSGTLGVRSGADGSFELPRTNEATAIVARSDGGYAQMQIGELRAGGGRVVLTAWARIEGTVRKGGVLRAGETVELFREGGSLEEWGRWHVMHEAHTKTDMQGRFVFAHVIGMNKGDLHGPGIRWRPASQGEDPRTYAVRVEEGKTAHVTLGGDGATIVGRINTGGKIVPVFRGVLSALVKPIGSTTQPTSTREAQLEPSPITFMVSQDGSFRVQDVMPGEYWLDLRSWMQAPGSRWVQEVAVAGTQVKVRDNTSGPGDRPIDLGVLTARVNELLLPGEKVPDFSAVAADNAGTRIVHFDEFRGRVVLICRGGRGWVANPGNGIDQDTALNGISPKALFDRFGSDPRLMILELTGEGSAEAVQTYRKSNGVPWMVAGASSMGSTRPADAGGAGRDALSRYDSSPVRFFLVDGEGKLVARWSTAGEAYSAIDRVLGKVLPGLEGVHVDTRHVPDSHAASENALGQLTDSSGGNLSRAAKFSVVGEATGEFGGTLSVLHDGFLAETDDEPSANFAFNWGTLEGRIKIDLEEAKTVDQINVFSRHKSGRAPQVYIVYGSDGTSADFNASPAIGVDPARCGWTHIAEVDSRPTGGGLVGGRYRTSVRRNSGALGKYRYLLFAAFVTETNDDWGHTFFSEIEVLGRREVKP